MKVITFSTKFPAKHPRAGQATFFVEKIWSALIELELISLSKCCELSRQTGIAGLNMNNIRQWKPESKHHTIRAGNRWKEGEWFSPRIWSGKPYASKQIEFAPPIQIKKIWTFEIVPVSDEAILVVINNIVFARIINGVLGEKSFDNFSTLAKNDGLSPIEMIQWFIVHPRMNATFKGQMLCWNESVNYLQ